MVKEEGEPEYLKKMKKESKWNRMVRFRMGEGVRECRYWMGEEENVCGVCRYERESWAHVLERCTGDEGGRVDERVSWILSGCGQGPEWMRKLEEMRDRAGCMG